MKKIYLLLLFSIVFIGAKSQSTTLVISQVYGGGGNSGAIYTNDFVEIFNKGTISVSLNGYSVQYASAAGNFGNSSLSTNLPNITLLPGQYFLIQQASGGAVGVALPTPDLTGTVSMAAGAGKVALVNTTTLLTATACPSSATIIDFVGYGTTANCFEGTASTAAPSSSLSVFRKLSGCQDTQDNSSDFATATPSARNTVTPLNPCSGSCTVPSQNASLLRMASSTPTSLSLLFNRGNGSGAIVLCKAASAVNAIPVNGTAYSANAVLGSGSQIGTGNFVVHSTTFSGVVGFNVTGLTVGTKYYFSVFEYNDPGKCYTATGLVDSFTVGATLFKPGDFVFIGWDANANAGEDELYLMNMVDITKGTKFSIVNSRFEAGAPANVRTNHWGGGGSDPWQDPDKHDFEYVGASTITKGSVISMESNSVSGFTNFKINGISVPSSDFSAKAGTSNFLSTNATDADQLYITQGTFTAYGLTGSTRYNLLNGLVIHGFTCRTAWVPLTSSVSSSLAGGTTRESRIPPDILCINTEFPINANTYANYNRAVGQTGTKSIMLGRLKNIINWTYAPGTVSVDDVITGDPSFSSSTYTINASAADGNWNGTVSNDWFDCSNWEGLHVPDSTSAIIINPIPAATNNCDINTTASTNAVQFTNIARGDSLTVLNGAVLSLTGAGTEKLKLENSLTINTNGLLQFDNNANSLTDTLFIHGTLRDEEASNNYSSPYGFQPGLGTVKMEDTRFASNPAALLKPTGFTNRFYGFMMNNSRDVSVKGITEINSAINLQTGYLTITAPDGKLSLKPGCSISSPVNVYGDLNKGYKTSFVNGKLYIETNTGFTNPVFPIGKVSATDTLFAPVEITKASSNAFTYDAEYFPGSYSNLAVDAGQLDHVSGLEYWSINSGTASVTANSTVKLSWRPGSLVGDGNPANDAAALNDLVVAHYFTDIPGTNPFLWHIEGGDVTTMPKGAGSTVNYGTVTTNLNNSPYTDPANTVYFTLGTRSPLNLLPVKFLDFRATPKLNEVSLKWITKEEKGLLYYEVERSKDAITYTPVGKLPATNKIEQNDYLIVDIKPFSGWNYYRLKIVETNGKISYSVVVKAWIGVTKQLLLYPNPAQKEIKLIFPGPRSTSTIAIVNSGGQVVQQLTTTDQSLAINIESLNKGVYFVKILTNQQIFVQKFSKQ